MKTDRTSFLPFLALLLLHALSLAGADALVDQKFDDLDLRALPAGWEKSEPSDSPLMSMIVEEGRGKVLKLSNKDAKTISLTLNLDLAQVAGKTLAVSTWAKFPGNYTPIADRSWARPRLLINAKDARGKTIHSISLMPQPQKPEWQELKDSITVPASAASVVAQFVIPEVECEAFFDGLNIVVTAAAPAVAPPVVAAPANAPKTPPPPTPAVTPAAPAPPPAAVVDPNNPAALAASAPKKTFDDGGMTFGPEYAARLQKSYPSKTVTANTAMFVGPGFAEKFSPPKLAAPWRVVAVSPKMTGPSATPRAMLLALPETLLKEKPEVVFISSDPAPGRKASSTESEDWEDISRLCVRFGALPVLIPHANESKDDGFDHIVQAFKKAADLNTFLMLSATPPEAFAKRAENLLKILDTHVFARVKISTEAGKTATPAGKTVDE